MPKKPHFLDGFVHKSTIGRGNFGVVSIVKCKDDGIRYVMKKIVFTGKSQKDRDVSLAEVDLLKDLMHPNVVKYHSHGSDKRNLYIVMEFCEGGDLAKHIKAQGDVPFQENIILAWLTQMVMGLRYVHSKKILHRDLKTQNVFLSKTGVVKLGDFGIAKVLDGTLEQAATVVGTPFYMSPEACQNQPYTYSSDMWAVGCIVYELCTRKHAFAANNLLGLVFQIVQGTYPPIEGYSPFMEFIVKGLLQTDPTKRLTCTQILTDERLDLEALSKVKTVKVRRLRKRSKAAASRVQSRSATGLDNSLGHGSVSAGEAKQGAGAGEGKTGESKEGGALSGARQLAEVAGPKPLEQRLLFNEAEPVTTTALRMLFVVGSAGTKRTRAVGAAAAAVAMGKLQHAGSVHSGLSGKAAARTKGVAAPLPASAQPPKPGKVQGAAARSGPVAFSSAPAPPSNGKGPPIGSPDAEDCEYSEDFDDSEDSPGRVVGSAPSSTSKQSSQPPPKKSSSAATSKARKTSSRARAGEGKHTLGDTMEAKEAAACAEQQQEAKVSDGGGANEGGEESEDDYTWCSDDNYSQDFSDDDDAALRNQHDLAEEDAVRKLMLGLKDEADVIDRIAREVKMQDVTPAALMQTKLDSMSDSVHQKPTKPLQSLHERMMGKREDLLVLFGKELYLKLYGIVKNNHETGAMPNITVFQRLLPASVNPMQVYKELEMIAFQSAMGADGGKLYGTIGR